MPSYNTYPAVDEEFNFPPVVRQAMALYTEFTNKFAAKALEGTVSGHIGNGANPHGTTKSQIGLGNADNTSDALKPISTAQAAVNADTSKKANGQIAEVGGVQSIPGIVGVEVLGDYAAVNLVTGRRYTARYKFGSSSPTADVPIQCKFLKSVVSDTTTAGTMIDIESTVWTAPIATSGATHFIDISWLATATETVNFKVTVKRAFGAATIEINNRRLRIFDEGAQF